MILQGTNLANIAEWKAQESVDREFEFSDFDEESAGVVFSQIKITLRGYGSGKSMGVRAFSINPKEQKKVTSKPSSVAISSMPSLTLEEDSDEERDILPTLKVAKTSIIDDRLAELKQKLSQEEKAKSQPTPITPAQSSVSFTVKVANQAEFDPGYRPEEEAPAAPAPAPIKRKSSVAPAPAPAAAAPKALPLAHVTLSVSGIGPERSEIRRIVTEMGGSYEHDMPNSVPAGRTLILLVDASSNQWRNTPKHQQAIALDAPIVDKSWLTACHKKGSFLAVGPYLYQFRTGEGKSASSLAAPPAAAAAPPSPAKPKKSTVKSEGGGFSTEKSAKGDEAESDGPDEYEYGDFVVADDDEIEYFDDELDEDKMVYNPSGHHSAHKSAAPKVSTKNRAAMVPWSGADSADQLRLFAAKCSAILGRTVTAADDYIADAHNEPAANNHKEAVFGMDIDDAGSDGTVDMEIDA